jgi:glycosyltransferase involved in cell wall biosynthesis
MEQELRDGAAGMEEVMFLPFQNQSLMPVIYRLGSVVCLPSKGPGETWGLVINEANACGVRCVVSDRAGCAEDLGEVKGNFVFASGEVDSLVEGLRASVWGDGVRESEGECESGEESESDELDREEFLERWNYGKVVEAIKRC